MNEMRKLMETIEKIEEAGIVSNTLKDVGKKMRGYLPAHEGTIRFVSVKVEDVILLVQLGKEIIDDPKAIKIFEEIRQELIIIKKYLRKKKAEHYKEN